MKETACLQNKRLCRRWLPPVWHKTALVTVVLALCDCVPSVCSFQPLLPSSSARHKRLLRKKSYLNAVKLDEKQTAPAKVRATGAGSADSMPSTIVNQQSQDGKNRDDNAAVDDPMIDPRDKVVMLGLLWITACLSALDRVAMSVALVPMTTEFGLTDTVKGSISSFFSVGYGLGIIPAGLILSFASPRLVMSVAVVAWSLATLATPWAAQDLAMGTASTTTALLGMRACVGAAESLVVPTLQRLLLSWTMPSEKAMGVATVVTGFQAGTIAAYLLSPVVMDTFSENGDAWRELFYTYGTVGLALVVPWLLIAKDGPDRQSVTTSRLDQEPSDRDASASWKGALQAFQNAPWSDFVRSKACWAMLLAHCSKNWGLYNSLAWTPTFYAEQYGIGVRDSAWLSVLPSVAGAVGGLVAGKLADTVLRQRQEVNNGVIDEEALTNVRKTFQAIALYGPAIALGALCWEIPEDPVVAQSFLMATVGLQAFTAAGFEAGNQEKAGPKWAGLLYSVTSLPAVIFGVTGVQTVGSILDATGQDWSLVFGLNAIVNVLGATAFVALYNSKKEFD